MRAVRAVRGELLQLDCSPFAGYGPELARNVQHGGVTGRHFVDDGIPWPDLAQRERIIMIVTNGCSGSDVSRAPGCLYRHQPP